jgi:serine/threonine-protein kinase RsbW
MTVVTTETASKSDTALPRTCSASYDQHTLNIEIQDEGNGFDVVNLPNPLAPENLLKPSGRGIFLIKSFMDRVEFNFQEKGAKLIMQKVFDKNIE